MPGHLEVWPTERPIYKLRPSTVEERVIKKTKPNIRRRRHVCRNPEHVEDPAVLQTKNLKNQAI
jgi:hypothetical protein